MELAEQAKAPYVHDITYGHDYFMHGHWLDRLPAMDDDIGDMEKILRHTRDTDLYPAADHGRPKNHQASDARGPCEIDTGRPDIGKPA